MYLPALLVFVLGIHSSYSRHANRNIPARDSDHIVFLDHHDYIPKERPCGGSCGRSEMVPVNFMMEISNYSVSELLMNYVDDYEEETLLANRFGDDVERSPAITAKPANCMPELKTIELVKSSDPTVIYLPTCTRIERCGGCCSHNLLTCEPKESETVSFKVIKTQFGAGNRLKFVGKEVVHVEKHTKCACGCRIKESDCNRMQEYRATECRCICINADEENKCYKDNATKLWDPDTCTCRCREVNRCSTGFSFDGNHCKCMPIPVRRRVIGADDVQKELPLDSLPDSVVYETSEYDST